MFTKAVISKKHCILLGNRGPCPGKIREAPPVEPTSKTHSDKCGDGKSSKVVRYFHMSPYQEIWYKRPFSPLLLPLQPPPTFPAGWDTSNDPSSAIGLRSLATTVPPRSQLLPSTPDIWYFWQNNILLENLCQKLHKFQHNLHCNAQDCIFYICFSDKKEILRQVIPLWQKSCWVFAWVYYKFLNWGNSKSLPE